MKVFSDTLPIALEIIIVILISGGVVFFCIAFGLLVGWIISKIRDLKIDERKIYELGYDAGRRDALEGKEE